MMKAKVTRIQIQSLFIMGLNSLAVILFSHSLVTASPIAKNQETNSQTASIETINQSYLLLDLSDRRVYVYQQGKKKASYPVAIGKKGWETPTGTFKILNMEHNPVWQNPFTGEVILPGNNNPLGAAVIVFFSNGKSYIGFHGTPNPHLIGQAVSHGCVRMHNQDILQLYEQVTIGMTVKVVP
jgi:lipoprotein-anchoring transpeptidase ErfK/SrfK